MSRLVCVLSALLAVACSESAPSPSESGVEVIEVKSVSGKIGSACEAHDECESGKCMQIEQWVEGSPRFCSVICNPSAAAVFASRSELVCPDGFTCSNPDGGLCFPTD